MVYRCPNCHSVIHELSYRTEVTDYGVFDLDVYTYDKNDEDLSTVTYYCPVCSYLLGDDLDEAIEALVEEGDEGGI